MLTAKVAIRANLLSTTSLARWTFLVPGASLDTLGIVG